MRNVRVKTGALSQSYYSACTKPCLYPTCGIQDASPDAHTPAFAFLLLCPQRLRQYAQLQPPHGAQADRGLPALLGDGVPRGRLPLRPGLHPHARTQRVAHIHVSGWRIGWSVQLVEHQSRLFLTHRRCWAAGAGAPVKIECSLFCSVCAASGWCRAADDRIHHKFFKCVRFFGTTLSCSLTGCICVACVCLQAQPSGWRAARRAAQRRRYRG